MKNGMINLVICFVIAVVIAPIIIKKLYKLKFGQSILMYVEKHQNKSGTATMGGMIFVLATAIGYMIFLSKDNILSTISMLSLLFFGTLGFLDDFIKIKFRQNEGLKPYQKIIGQLGIATIIAFFVYYSGLVGTTCIVPFTNITIDFGIFIIPFVIIFYIAVVNSVNLIDGLDGLCSGVSIVILLTCNIVVYIISLEYSGVYATEIGNMLVTSMGLVGALLGFVCYNSYPAKVFMGDTGSLAIGGFVASMFALTRNYFLIFAIGIMLVITTMSVIIQVTSFKLRRKRIFKMAPIHHLFEQYIHENKVVAIYVILSLLVGILSISMYI